MSIKDQVDATLKRRNEKAYQSTTIETSARNNQARLNARRKADTEALTKAVLAKHRPDITLVRYYNAENVTLECGGIQKTYEARYIRRAINSLFGGINGKA